MSVANQELLQVAISYLHQAPRSTAEQEVSRIRWKRGKKVEDTWRGTGYRFICGGEEMVTANTGVVLLFLLYTGVYLESA